MFLYEAKGGQNVPPFCFYIPGPKAGTHRQSGAFYSAGLPGEKDIMYLKRQRRFSAFQIRF